MKTEKQFYQLNDALVNSGATDNQLYKIRTIWKLATNNYKLKKVSDQRLEKAKKVYNSIRKMWKYKDLNLEYDSLCSEYGERRSHYYSKKEDKKAEEIKPLLKELKLCLWFSTYAHVNAADGSMIF